MQRPLDVYEKLCAEQGLTLLRTPEYVYAEGIPDLSDITVSGATSSQFITGLLLAAPLSGRDCTLIITPPFVSRPYVDITRSVMADFGVSAEYTDENTLFVKGGQKYKAAECTAEGDWSGAAFLYALKTLGGAVTVTLPMIITPSEVGSGISVVSTMACGAAVTSGRFEGNSEAPTWAATVSAI